MTIKFCAHDFLCERWRSKGCVIEVFIVMDRSSYLYFAPYWPYVFFPEKEKQQYTFFVEPRQGTNMKECFLSVSTGVITRAARQKVGLSQQNETPLITDWP